MENEKLTLIENSFTKALEEEGFKDESALIPINWSINEEEGFIMLDEDSLSYSIEKIREEVSNIIREFNEKNNLN